MFHYVLCPERSERNEYMIIKMILTNSFDPDPRVYKEAKTLADSGHDIEILAWDRENKNLNKAYEEMDGIKIRRFYANATFGTGIKQMKGFINFIKQVKKYINNCRYDFLHCHDFDGLIIGYCVKVFNSRVNLIYDEHDLFYLYFEGRKGYFNKLIAKGIKIVEQIVLNKVDHHIVVTPNMKLLYEKKTNPIVITNAPLRSSFENIRKLKREKIVVGFIGAVRYIDELKILADVASEFPAISIFIAGRGTKLNEFIKYTEEKAYNNIEIFGEYNIAQLEDLYSRIDITYLVYPMKDSIISLPNKFFESIITKTPMISYNNSEFGDIIKNKNFGWCVESDNMELNLRNIFSSLVSNDIVLEEVRNNMSNESTNYLWESNVDKLLKIYES